MHVTRPRRTQRIGLRVRRLCFALGLLAPSLATAAARADVTTLDDTQAPIVRISIRQGDVTVRTWDRHSVSVEGEPSLSIERRLTRQPFAQTPVFIPPVVGAAKNGAVLLPSEGFVVSTIPPGPREAIFIRRAGNAASGPVIVTVPSDTTYVFAYARNGNLDVNGYREGTLVAFTGRGRLAVANAAGTVFAQTGRGALTFADSHFDRVRARSLAGNITFEQCRARQIEATSVNGSIVYDGGAFDEGLAHFESARGDIAIGAQGAVQLGARVAGGGRVFTNFERGARVSGSDDETSAVAGTGGPVVTAATQSGNVYLYDGTLRTRRGLSEDWQAPLATLQHPSLRHPGAAGAPLRFRAPPRPRRREAPS